MAIQTRPNIVRVLDTHTRKEITGPTFVQRVKEITSVMVAPFLPGSGLRSWGVKLGKGGPFSRAPAYDGTTVSYDTARLLYRNDGKDTNLGSFFAKPIIDLTVQFLGLPTASTEDVERDDFLNACIKDFWAPELLQLFRNSLRDSVTYARVFQDPINDPLQTVEEREHGRLGVVDPERITVYRNFQNNNVIDEVIIVHKVLRRVQVAGNETRPDLGFTATQREEEIWEIIDKEEYRYWNRTKQEWEFDKQMLNTSGFVPIEPFYNEYDSTLSGGQSDLESVYSLILAFHDVLQQGLGAHKYHSDPKLKLKLKDITPFLENNFRDVLDPATGKPIQGATISLSGREVYFLNTEEDVDVVQIKSVLGDTHTLLVFLLECICIASQTPKWAFMLDVGAADKNEMLPFIQKIERKRLNFQRPIQNLLKMIEKMNKRVPIRAKLSWPMIRDDQLVTRMQAFQQLTMALEVLAQRKLISDETMREAVRLFLPMMKNPDQEEKEAEDNFDPLALEELLKNATTGDTSNGNGNGKNTPVKAGQQGANE